MLIISIIVTLLSVLLENVNGDATPWESVLFDRNLFLPNYPSDSVYSIVGSDTIKEGDVFRFSALSRNFNEPLQANFTIFGTGIDDSPIIIEQPNAVLLADQLSHFQFDVRNLNYGSKFKKKTLTDLKASRRPVSIHCQCVRSLQPQNHQRSSWTSVSAEPKATDHPDRQGHLQARRLDSLPLVWDWRRFKASGHRWRNCCLFDWPAGIRFKHHRFGGI